MPLFIKLITQYLHQVLGLTGLQAQPWAGSGQLPYYLQDAFELWTMDLLGHGVILAAEKRLAKPSVGNIQRQVDTIESLAGRRVVYVATALASYERKRLIEQKVPFIVPGNQLYLPDLGIDLREYFRKRQSDAELLLSPSTQALLIRGLLRSTWSSRWYPSETMIELGYTAMTLSRAVRELNASGLASVDRDGRRTYLEMSDTARATWERARPLMRNPVKRTVWTLTTANLAGLPARLAGQSALAQYTLISPPQIPVYAVHMAAWRDFGRQLVPVPEPMPGATEWQLWSYSPFLQEDSKTVDVLSLILSLQDSADDRLQLAIDELTEQLPC